MIAEDVARHVRSRALGADRHHPAVRGVGDGAQLGTESIGRGRIVVPGLVVDEVGAQPRSARLPGEAGRGGSRSEEHTSELQSQSNLVCRLLLEKKKTNAT